MSSSPPVTPTHAAASKRRQELDAILNAASPSPLRLPATNKRGRDELGSDDNATDATSDNPTNTDESSAVPSATSGTGPSNVLEYGRRVASQKRLKLEQCSDMDSFVLDGPIHRQIKIYAELMAVGNHLNKLQAAAPEFKISQALKTNISSFAVNVMLSSKIRSYKGEVPLGLLMVIILTKRFDLPPGFESVPADLKKVQREVGNAFTQLRSKLKKILKKSIIGPNKDHLTVYKLAQAMAEGTNVRVTANTCARVAVLRHVYMTHKGEDYWDKVDSFLADVRRQAEKPGQPNKTKEGVAKIFRHYLTEDHKAHGDHDDGFVIDNMAQDPVQDEVDEMIEKNQKN